LPSPHRFFTSTRPSCIENGIIRDAAGVEQTTAANVAATACYSPHQIPLSTVPPLEVQERGEMPDIDVFHVSTPTLSTQLGAKGVGEAGTIGGLGCNAGRT
jgi:hypothetical protein